MERARFAALAGDINAIRRQSLVVGPAQVRTFTIDVSRYEYCDPKTEARLDHFIIYVYTPEMIAVEKVRAICQQMARYTLNTNPRARARDFYDIAVVIRTCRVDLSSAELQDLTRHIFAAKEVPLSFIADIRESREFHRSDWPKVEQATAVLDGSFDDYFDFVVAETQKLEPLWIE